MPNYSLRRLLVVLAAVVGVALVASAVVFFWPDPESSAPSTSATGGGGELPDANAYADDAEAAGATWVARENAHEGSDGWRVRNFDVKTGVHGYADRTSALGGETVNLMVSTKAPTFHVEAYRMGHYGGKRGRLLWKGDEVPGRQQGEGHRDPGTNLIEMGWQPSTEVQVGSDWPPGVYLLKLVGSDGTDSVVPLVVRDDATKSKVAVLIEFTTWQAYNTWGGCSLYECPGVQGEKRAKVVSFDRPYARGDGAQDFVGLELPLIDLAEEQGLDLAYFSLLDLEADPQHLAGRTAVLSLGHDEYYSPKMRDAVDAALAGGANMAFFGANAMYRNIRFENGPSGAPMRRMVNYRDTTDPIMATDKAQTTTQWRSPPLSRPEGAVVGIQYECAPTKGDVVLVDTSAWMFQGTGAQNGTKLVGVLGEEYDRWFSGVSPKNLQILAHSPTKCRDKTSYSDMSWYSHPGGGGVFATGTNRWIPGIDGSMPVPTTPETVAIVKAVTVNVLRELSQPKAGERHPSQPNVSQFWK